MATKTQEGSAQSYQASTLATVAERQGISTASSGRSRERLLTSSPRIRRARLMDFLAIAARLSPASPGRRGRTRTHDHPRNDHSLRLSITTTASPCAWHVDLPWTVPLPRPLGPHNQVRIPGEREILGRLACRGHSRLREPEKYTKPPLHTRQHVWTSPGRALTRTLAWVLCLMEMRRCDAGASFLAEAPHRLHGRSWPLLPYFRKHVPPPGVGSCSKWEYASRGQIAEWILIISSFWPGSARFQGDKASKTHGETHSTCQLVTFHISVRQTAPFTSPSSPGLDHAAPGARPSPNPKNANAFQNGLDDRGRQLNPSMCDKIQLAGHRLTLREH